MVVLVAAFTTFLAVASTAGARVMRKDEAKMRQAEAAKRWQRSPGPSVLDSTNVRRTSDAQNITFTNPKASGKLGWPWLLLVVTVIDVTCGLGRVLCRWEYPPAGRFRRWT